MKHLFLHIVWNVSPEIFTIGQFQLRWYGVLFALSFFLGYRILLNVFRKETIDIKYLDKLVLYMGIGTLIGARLGHCLLYQPDYYLSNPLEILKIWKGGLASHGAAVGIIIALGIYALAEKINFLWIIDRMVIVVALSGFLIRIGNFINSEII
ncbi:MAG: prolipoprotein diacylglyceryl transferase, partial [Marinilabiliales bacterium]